MTLDRFVDVTGVVRSVGLDRGDGALDLADERTNPRGITGPLARQLAGDHVTSLLIYTEMQLAIVPASRGLAPLADMNCKTTTVDEDVNPDRQGYLRATPRTIVGASILVQAPTGGYESDKVINVGTNRWAVKPAVGVIWPMRPTWLLEFELGYLVFRR